MVLIQRCSATKLWRLLYDNTNDRRFDTGGHKILSYQDSIQILLFNRPIFLIAVRSRSVNIYKTN